MEQELTVGNAHITAEIAGPAISLLESVGPFTIHVLASHIFARSAEKIGGTSMAPVIRDAIDDFLKQKLKRILTLELQPDLSVLAANDLNLGNNDKGLMWNHEHFALKVGEKTGLFILFYKQVIDPKNSKISFYLSKVVTHREYDTSKSRKDLKKSLVKMEYEPINVLRAAKPDR